MDNRNKPCIAFEMDNLDDALNHMEYEVVEEYGDECNGNWLHTWDDGKRFLGKCRNCGGYILVQMSEAHSFTGNDSYYTDFFPVSGSCEAKELNELYNGFEIEQKFPEKYIMETNGTYAWHRPEKQFEESLEKQSKKRSKKCRFRLLDKILRR